MSEHCKTAVGFYSPDKFFSPDLSHGGEDVSFERSESIPDKHGIFAFFELAEPFRDAEEINIGLTAAHRPDRDIIPVIFIYGASPDLFLFFTE